MYVLFEETGKFLAGRVMSEAEASAQVELDSGKRVKVKAAQMLLKFDKPAPAALLSEAAAVAQTIELDLAWEFAPEEEFGFADLATDYFSSGASTVQQAAAFKHSDAEVEDGKRVDQVMRRVTRLAGELGADAALTAKIYRTMIAHFIESEREERLRLVGTAEARA